MDSWACTYSRAGVLWSDPTRGPNTGMVQAGIVFVDASHPQQFARLMPSLYRERAAEWLADAFCLCVEAISRDPSRRLVELDLART
jgi:hypothetical protein